MGQVAIFIDGSNLYHRLREEFCVTKIDMGKLVTALIGGRSLTRAYYYNAPLNQRDNLERYQTQQRYFDRLRQIPYFEVKLGRLERRPSGWVEKGVDLLIAMDMLQLAHRNVYDTAILVSGDGDFAAVVQAVKDMGKHVENAFPKSGRAKALANTCDKFTIIDEKFVESIRLIYD